jgi:DNA gyrase subunit A
MKRSYLDYAMSVIVGRALPDVRDGLKPVHRRVLYAMYDTNNTHDKAYKKSARTVGSVIGRFHPHGDTAVYDTIVRLAQDFSMRYPMVDGQGNFGSVDGDRAAAMRYTEIRLQKLAAQMLRDIEKETVEFLENYDGSESEPAVLPAAIPNLLVNGSDGIAVGMATKIPPHNLGEVIDAIKLLIENPEAGLAEILEVLPGPDFPTAGYIYGRAGIHQAYATGRGRVIMRGKAEIEPWPGKKDRERVIIRELPYQVNKAQLVKDIAGLVKDKKIEGISDIRDESDRDGIRVVIEVKRGENANILLNQLYKFTKLQSTFGINSLAIVNGRPETLPVRQMLKHFIDFRKEVVVRRTMFDLRKAEDRAHILEGLKIAIDNLDEVIKRIRESKTPAEAKISLKSRFSFSDRQAQAILDMRLHRLTGLERQKIIDEYEEIIKLIAGLKEILASDALQFRIILDEMDEIRNQFSDPRRTEIVDSEEEISLEDLIQEEDMVITVTRTGYVKRTALSAYRAQKRGGKGRKGMTPRAEDLVDTLFVASTHDYILVFTSAGKMHWLKVYRIPEVGADGKGKALVNLIQIGKDETVAAILAVRDFDDDRYVVLSSRRGFIKKTALSAFSNPRAAGIIAIKIEEGDEVLSAGLSDGNSEIFIATASGKSIRFKESDVRPMGRTTRGVIAIRCAKSDRLVAMEILSGKPDILTISSGGYGKRTDHTEYRTQGRGGSGILNMRTTDKIGEVVASMEVDESDHVMIVTAKGKIIRMDVAGVSRIGRATQGVRMIQLNEGDAVVSATRTSEDDEEEENGE